MLDSIFDDIKRQIQTGNTVTRIIVVNVVVFVLLNLIYVFDAGAHGAGATDSFYYNLRSYLTLPSDPMSFLKRFWTLITYMFTQDGFWPLAWSMLLFYWFGRILGDFIGDKKVLPLYLMSGLVCGMVFILVSLLLGASGSTLAMGAFGAVIGVLVATATLSPDYSMRLILIGSVNIKWIVLVIVGFNILSSVNGGNLALGLANLGGAIFGYLYITQLRKGQDLTGWLQNLIYRDWRPATSTQYQAPKVRKTPRKSALSVVHKQEEEHPPSAARDQAKLDSILDKIKESGYDNLSQKEKDYLHLMSKS